jgi:hypothetical protein
MTDIHDDDCICEKEDVKKISKTSKKTPKSIKSILERSIYDKNLVAPHVLAKESPKAIVSKCKSVQPIKLEDMEIEKVFVEYRIKGLSHTSSNTPRIESKRPMEAPKRLSICEGLKLAGFSADWTKEKVAKLMNTPDGAQILKHVDEQYRELTGKSALSEKDIISCYPNYLKKEKRNVELLLELDGDENILSVSEKNESNTNVKSNSKSKKSKPVKP